jgi:lipoprotein-anchoring transpeptidase ErfK/SrfK
MNARFRDIVTLVVGLGLLLALALGGYAAVRARAEGSGASQPLAPVEMPTPDPTSAPRPQYERWTVGVAQRPVTVRTRPANDAPLLAKLDLQTAAAYPTLLLVDTVREVEGVPWYRVWVPVRPNGTRGWVRDGQLAFYTTASKIVIDLSDRTLMVYRRGELEGRFRVAVGSPDLPTPTGEFFVTQKLRPPDPSGVYGVLQLGTSAFQPKLKDWPDGGVVGIHGTNEPQLIGKAISHGCVRMKNAAIVEVSRLVPSGSPVLITR